jgi:hypothetical protein
MAVTSRIVVRRLAAPALVLALLSSGCGQYIRNDRAPVTLIITALEAAQGNEPDVFGTGILPSDVITNGTIFNDVGRVSMRLTLKDPGQPGITNAPSSINAVTITRYRVEYLRSDGRNTPGIDVPYPIDGGVTFTVPAEGEVQSGFELVRHTAKIEPPLLNLRNNLQVISTMAEVTFYGHDQAGNAASVTGHIQIAFANHGDPEAGSGGGN